MKDLAKWGSIFEVYPENDEIYVVNGQPFVDEHLANNQTRFTDYKVETVTRKEVDKAVKAEAAAKAKAEAAAKAKAEKAAEEAAKKAKKPTPKAKRATPAKAAEKTAPEVAGDASTANDEAAKVEE